MARGAASGRTARRRDFLDYNDKHDGLDCRCCDFVAHNRKELLKHVEKTGHYSVRKALPDGLYYIEPETGRDQAAEKIERRQQAAAVARGRTRAANERQDHAVDLR